MSFGPKIIIIAYVNILKVKKKTCQTYYELKHTKRHFFVFSVRHTHAQIEKRDASWVVKAMDADARVLVNGEPCVGEAQLNHRDRFIFFVLIFIETRKILFWTIAKLTVFFSFYIFFF